MSHGLDQGKKDLSSSGTIRNKKTKLPAFTLLLQLLFQNFIFINFDVQIFLQFLVIINLIVLLLHSFFHYSHLIFVIIVLKKKQNLNITEHFLNSNKDMKYGYGSHYRSKAE